MAYYLVIDEQDPLPHSVLSINAIRLYFYLLFYSSISLSQDWTFYGFFPAISQSGILNKKLQYNLYLSSTIDAFYQTVENKALAITALQYYLQPSSLYKIRPLYDTKRQLKEFYASASNVKLSFVCRAQKTAPSALKMPFMGRTGCMVA